MCIGNASLAPAPLPSTELYRELTTLSGWRLTDDGQALGWSSAFSTATASNAFLRWVLEVA